MPEGAGLELGFGLGSAPAQLSLHAAATLPLFLLHVPPHAAKSGLAAACTNTRNIRPYNGPDKSRVQNSRILASFGFGFENSRAATYMLRSTSPPVQS